MNKKKKKEPIKKYTMEITETQAQAMMVALEAFTRLAMGQYSIAVELSIPFSKLPGHNEELEFCYRQMKHIIHGLRGGSFYSITSDELPMSARISHDIYQTIRHRLAWDRKPEGGHSLEFDEPLKISHEDLPKIRLIEDDSKNKL